MTIVTISILFKATAILMLALLAIRLAHRSRASVRHAMLAATFVALAALPLALAVLPPLEFPVLPGSAQSALAPVSDSADAAGAKAEAARSDESLAVALAEAVSRGATNTTLSFGHVVLGIWVIGISLVLLALVIGVYRVHRLRRSALPLLETRQLMPPLLTAAGVRAAVDVVVHEDLSAPITCGLLRPAIVLPPDAQQWPHPALTRALVHELEHVKRRDWAVQILARTVCAIYWFHPLVWVAYRQLCLQAEHACDDAVVTREEDTVYADQLVTLARRMAARPAVAVLGMANRSDLAARVTAVLDVSRVRGRTGVVRASVIAATALALVVTLAPLQLVAETEEFAEALRAKAESEARRDGGVPSGDGAAVPQRRVARLDRTLVEAADEGDLRDVRDLLDDGANINAAVAGDGSPLIVAARGGHRDIVQLLLERGADINLGVPGDGAPLIMAAREGHVAIVQLLLDRGANIEVSVAGDENALIQASGAGRLEIVTLLVARGADVNARVWADRGPGRPDGEWRTPLSMAVQGGHRDVADVLRSAGAVE